MSIKINDAGEFKRLLEDLARELVDANIYLRMHNDLASAKPSRVQPVARVLATDPAGPFRRRSFPGFLRHKRTPNILEQPSERPAAHKDAYLKAATALREHFEAPASRSQDSRAPARIPPQRGERRSAERAHAE